MKYKEQIEKFMPLSIQEESDKKIIIEYIKSYSNVLLRENKVAHITSSALILNKDLSKMLMIHHNIYNTWAWTGGHADGEEDLLYTALKEAKEETGVKSFTPLTEDVISLDILPVYGHMKKGSYVSAHLHLTASFVLIVEENEKLTIKEDENSGVMWVNVDSLEKYSNEPYLIEIYRKIIKRAKEI